MVIINEKVMKVLVYICEQNNKVTAGELNKKFIKEKKIFDREQNLTKYLKLLVNENILKRTKISSRNSYYEIKKGRHSFNLIIRHLFNFVCISSLLANFKNSEYFKENLKKYYTSIIAGAIMSYNYPPKNSKLYNEEFGFVTPIISNSPTAFNFFFGMPHSNFDKEIFPKIELGSLIDRRKIIDFPKHMDSILMDVLIGCSILDRASKH